MLLCNGVGQNAGWGGGGRGEHKKDVEGGKARIWDSLSRSAMFLMALNVTLHTNGPLRRSPSLSLSFLSTKVD